MMITEYNELTVYRKIYLLKGSFTIPMSAYNELQIFDNSLEGNSREKPEFKLVKLDDIVGTTHPDYCHSKNWVDFFDNLKKINHVSTLLRYADFFKLDAYEKVNPDYSLIEYDSKFWISAGNNRICIAKIAGIEAIWVSVSRVNK